MFLLNRTLILLTVMSQLACIPTRNPIDEEESLSAEAESVEDDDSLPAVTGPEGPEVDEKDPAEEEMIETKFIDFTAPVRYNNDDNPFGGVPNTCEEKDFGMLTQSITDESLIWLCEADESGQYFWTPQTTFRDYVLGFDEDEIISYVKPASFAFKNGDNLFWGWYIPYTGTVFDVEVDGIELFVNTIVDEEIVKSNYTVSFTAFTHNVFVDNFDNSNDLELIARGRSDGTSVDLTLMFDEETVLFNISGITLTN